jgi:pilus assembly protein CpaC
MKILNLIAAALLILGSAAPLAAEDTELETNSPAEVPGGTIQQGSGKQEYAKEGKDGELKPFTGKEKSLTVSLGVSKVLEFDFDIGPIYLTDDKLLRYRRVKENGKDRKLLIVPQTPGFTDMTIHDANFVPRIKYMVRVAREDMGEVINQLQSLLGDIEGLKISALGGTIILDGEILLPKDMIRVMRVVDAMKDRDPKKKEVPIRNLASISKVTMNIIAERIEREIGSPEITARVINNNLFLEGTAESDYEADRAIEIARTYLPEVFVERTKGEGGEVRPKAQGGVGGGLPSIVDLLRVRPRQAAPPSQDIKITMNYVELSNEYSRTFNFHWQPMASDSSSVKFDSSVGELTSQVVATISSLFPKLNTARDHGHAKILREQSVIVKDRSDAPAVIESSVQYYSQIAGPTGVPQLQAIPVNNVTKVKAATIPGSDAIDLGVQIQLSTVLGLNGGVPIISNNSLQTQVTVKNGDSAALGGNAIEQALSGYNREPQQGGASQLQQAAPSTQLFNFQRSKNFKHDKQQYVIFVTPEVIRTASAGTEDITRKFRLKAGEQ